MTLKGLEQHEAAQRLLLPRARSLVDLSTVFDATARVLCAAVGDEAPEQRRHMPAWLMVGEGWCCIVRCEYHPSASNHSAGEWRHLQSEIDGVVLATSPRRHLVGFGASVHKWLWGCSGGGHSQETKDKLSKAQTGKHHSQSAKDKIAAAKTGSANPRYNPDYNPKMTPCPNPTCLHGFATPKPSVVLRRHLYGDASKDGREIDGGPSLACGKWVKDQVAAGNDAVLKAAFGRKWRQYMP